jgi:signal transduction histidine kinase/ligand-binding sensor domain-containing protein
MRNNVSQPVHKPEAFRLKLKLTSIVAGISPFLCGGVLLAQHPNYSLKAWQTGEGLPQDSVTSIVQTPDGYLWVATFNGLARFDGARFTVFDEGNTPALQSSRLVRLDVGYDGRLWIINEQGGLAQLWQGRFRSWTDREGVPAAGVAAVIRGPHRRALLVDRAGGVSRLEGEKWIPDPLSGVAGADRVSFAMDPHERLWVLSLRKRCLGLLAGGQVDWLQGPNGGEPAAVRGLAFGRGGGLWVVLTNRIWHYECEAKEWKATDWVLPESVRSLTCITEDRQGDLWVSSYGCGVLHFGPEGAYELFTTAEGLSHDAVRALWADQEGSLWAGTDGGGLNRIRRKTVTTYGLRDGLSGEVVMGLAPDQHERGSLWIGLNGGGLNRLRNPKSIGPLFEPRLLTNAYVYGVLEDRQGGLWVGAYDRGILHYADGRLMPLAKSNEWADKPLLAALEDRSGAIWLGGSFGLLRYQRGQLTKLNSQLGWSNLTVRALAEDRAGNVYVGSYGKGLSRYTRGQWTHYRERDGLADDHIGCLYVDGEDQLWIGTFNGGLSRWKHGRFANVSMREGLPSNSISSIVEDGDGHLWLGSSRGLFRVRKVQVDELAQGRRHVVTGRTYGLGEGLATLECGGGAQPAACRTDDGRLWFATVKGLTVVDPAKLPVSSSPVPVVLEEVLVDGKPLGVSVVTGKMVVSPGPSARKAQQVSAPVPILAGRATVDKSTAALIVPPGSERVEFRFTGLSFLAPEQMRFRFQLEGFDADWIDGGNQRLTSYTHIPPGDYVFRVSACNNDGVWSEPGAALGFVVLPPWWATWWFRLAALLTVAALFFGWVELRLSRVRQQQALQEAFSRRLIASQEDERRRIAGELHDGLGQNLVLIRNRAELGIRQLVPPPALEEQLREISAAAAQSLEEVRSTAHALRPYELERLGLTRAVEDAAQKAAGTSGVKFACDMDSVDGLLPQEIEVALFRIVQEALNNVLRHAHASEVIIELKKEAGWLRLTVLDNGCGFDAASPAGKAGFGLANMTARTKMVRGKLHIDSAPGRGTALTVRLPVKEKPV